MNVTVFLLVFQRKLFSLWCSGVSVFPPSPQSTSGSAQVGLLPQGVRLLRSPAVPQTSSDAFAFSQTAVSSLEQNFMAEDISTPKVSPGGSGCYYAHMYVLKTDPHKPSRVIFCSNCCNSLTVDRRVGARAVSVHAPCVWARRTPLWSSASVISLSVHWLM